MDAIGDGLDKSLQEARSGLDVGCLVQLREGELGCPVDGHEQMRLAFLGSDLGNVDVEETDGVALDGLLWLVAFHLRQSADAMPLQASVQRRARQVRDRRLQSIKAVVERQQRMLAKSDDRGLLRRAPHGVDYVVSDDHAGLRAARRAVLGGAKWQRCQFHLARNAIHHAPNVAIRKRIGAELRTVWNSPDLAKAEAALLDLVAAYRDTASKLAAWLEENLPEGLTVFALPEHHRRRLRTSNPIERSVQQELKRCTVKIRVFRPIRSQPSPPSSKPVPTARSTASSAGGGST